MLSAALTIARIFGDTSSFALLAIAALGAVAWQEPADISRAPAAVESADTLFGFSVCALGDLDGDGVDEFAVTAPHARKGENGAGSVLVFSGRTLDVLRRFDGAALHANLGLFVRRPGDLDDDGREDLELAPIWLEAGADPRKVFLSPSRGVEVSAETVSGALERRRPPCGTAITDSRDSGLYDTKDDSLDWDRDGCPDVVRHQFGPPDQIEIVSGATGAPLLFFDLPDRSRVTHFAHITLDLDGDHIGDLLMNVSGEDYGRLLAISGADGSRLYYQFLELLSGPDSMDSDLEYGLFAVGDLDCDGCDDFILTRPHTFRTELDAFSGRSCKWLWSVGRGVSDTRQCTLDVLSDRNGDGAPEILYSNLYWLIDGPDWDRVGSVGILSGKDGVPLTVLYENRVYLNLAAANPSTPPVGETPAREKR